MDDSELNQLLKSVSPPERGADYWKEFPRRVTTKLHWRKDAVPGTEGLESGRRFYARWGWGLAAACVVAAFAIGFWRGRESGLNEPQLAEARKYYDEVRALFPHQIRAIVFEEQGPRLILADKPNIPDSTALFVRVCAPDGCRSFVTFSGQKIQVNGEACEVLADADDRVMLVGKDRAWANNLPAGRVRVQGRALDVAM